MPDIRNGKMDVNLWARNDTTGDIQPIEIDNVTGQLKVTSSFTGTLSVAIDQSNDSILVFGFDGINNQPISTDPSGQLNTNIVSSIPAGSNNIGDVDVATLPDVTQPTHDNLNANVNIQVGDIDVDGTNPVPIANDATGVLTIDATNLDIRNLNPAQDTVEAQLFDGSGNSIGSTAGALDVNIASGVTIEVNLDEANDSVQVFGNDGANNQPINTDVNGRLNTNIVDPLPAGTNNIGDVDVATLPDVTQPTHDNLNANANIQVGDSDVGATNPVPISNDSSGTLTVDATDLDIRDLSAASDSVESRIHDGSGTAIGSTGGALDVNIASGVTIEVNLDEANDSVQVYGFDGAANQPIATDASGNLQVDVIDSVLPTGAATEATLSSIDTDTSSISTDASTIAGAVAGTEMQVDVVAPLPAGTNNIGDVDIASGPTGGSALEAQGTAADGSPAVGNPVQVGGVDGLGDAQALATDTDGHPQIDVLSSALPTGAATEATLSSIDTDTTSISADASTIAGDTTSIDGKTPSLGQTTMAGSVPVAVASDQSDVPVTATDLDIRDLDATQDNIESRVHDGAGNSIGSTAGALDVNIASGVTLEVNLDEANDSVQVYGFDGAANQPIATDASGNLQVDVLASALPTGAATEATLSSIDADTGSIATDASTIAGAVSGTEMQVDVVGPLPAGTNNIGDVDIASGPTGASALEMQGTAADGAAAVGNPVQVGGKDGSGNIQTIATDTDGKLEVGVVNQVTEVGMSTDKQAGDSSTTPLGAGATFTGTGFSTANRTAISVVATADESGVLFIEQSTDGGSNYDLVQEYNLAANDTLAVIVPTFTEHARIRFENTSASSQTFFRLGTYTRAGGGGVF